MWQVSSGRTGGVTPQMQPQSFSVLLVQPLKLHNCQIVCMPVIASSSSVFFFFKLSKFSNERFCWTVARQNVTCHNEKNLYTNFTLAHFEYLSLTGPISLAIAFNRRSLYWNIVVPWNSGLIYMGRLCNNFALVLYTVPTFTSGEGGGCELMNSVAFIRLKAALNLARPC